MHSALSHEGTTRTHGDREAQAQKTHRRDPPAVLASTPALLTPARPLRLQTPGKHKHCGQAPRDRGTMLPKTWSSVPGRRGGGDAGVHTQDSTAAQMEPRVSPQPTASE